MLRSSVLALALALSTLVAGAAQAAPTLERVVVVMRHGVRPPTQTNDELAQYSDRALAGLAVQAGRPDPARRRDGGDDGSEPPRRLRRRRGSPDEPLPEARRGLGVGRRRRRTDPDDRPHPRRVAGGRLPHSGRVVDGQAARSDLRRRSGRRLQGRRSARVGPDRDAGRGRPAEGRQRQAAGHLRADSLPGRARRVLRQDPGQRRPLPEHRGLRRGHPPGVRRGHADAGRRLGPRQRAPTSIW